MKIASVAEIKSQLSAYLKETEAGPVVVTRNGKAVAVIVGIEDEDELEGLLMAHSPRLQAILEISRRQIRKGDVLNHEEFWNQVKKVRTPAQRDRKQVPSKKPSRPNKSA